VDNFGALQILTRDWVNRVKPLR